MRNLLPGIILATLSAATIAGCTTTSAGTPTPDPTSSTANTSSSTPADEPPADNDGLPSDGAPKVTNPIDVSHFEQNPCEVLKPAEAADLKVESGKRQDTSFGKGCTWRNSETGGVVSMDFASTDKRGLSSAYRSGNNGEFTYFEPIDDIKGHPAVAYDISSDHPTSSCFVAVGVTDELMFSTHVRLSSANVGHKDPCELSAMAAGMMLKNMQGGS